MQDSLHSLMTMLGQANPYFVRCIKPNVEKRPDMFLPQVVLNQLKYSGEFNKITCSIQKTTLRLIFCQ